MFGNIGKSAAGWALILAALALVAAAAWLASDRAFRSETASIGPIGSEPADALDRRIRDYILRNPEVIVEALRRLDRRERAAQTSELEAIIESRSDEIFRDPESPVGGNPDGDVTLVEFFDDNCPYCRSVAPTLIELERGDPGLRVVYKEFPILGPNSVFAARAALASRRQGKYVAFHKALMRADGLVDEDTVMDVAEEAGIDVARLKADMDDPALAAAIERNIDLARALRITGTPGFVIGAEILRGAADPAAFKALIKRAREAR